jgi:hypothetical protein
MIGSPENSAGLGGALAQQRWQNKTTRQAALNTDRYRQKV